ncbi:guanylate kinase [Leptospira levettii]|uniref:guanylate kinase n=1 Tax=Leptospira levettii TaxID=2023178 RepID=UPI000C2A09B4|nr:guanylate kinase [Leptospira levettii]PKA27740.1 guanylate kinase [Leptospira sp. mixed culture ATI2-C-A1]MCW7473386.1 guanylate kinase [Leptospira levettii]MCW7495390.1 guanylate kinase [Leptospira levettii]MCW7508223.1 guanylate kinase [Leptospira levettii]MCW7519313.1 guanylate kinase [Leptospira levettii]
MKAIPNLYIISSVAGGGKSTIIQALLKENPEFYFSISCTTRDPRPGDEEGKTYYFLTTLEFQKRIAAGEFYEWAEVHGNYYGTPKAPILEAIKEHRVALLDLDVQGAKSAKELRPESVTIFIEPPSREIWIERLIRRGTDSKTSIEKRIENGIKELEEAPNFDYVVINDKLEDAITEVKAILCGTKTKTQ